MRFDFYHGVFSDSSSGQDRTAIATAMPNHAATWNDLKQMTDRFLESFQELGLVAGQAVVVSGEETFELFAAYVACIRAGLPFAPLADTNPQERFKLAAKKIGARVLIKVGEPEKEDFGFSEVIQVFERRISLKRTPTSGAPVLLGTDVLYIIFTSGSTGEPKAVPISRNNFKSFLDWSRNGAIPIKAVDRCLNLFSPTFDGVFILLANALEQGAAFFHLGLEGSPSDSARDVTVAAGTPSALSKLLADPSFSSQNFSQLKTFFLGGEQLRSDLLTRLQTRFPAIEVYNLYGPTEATIAASSVRLTRQMATDHEFLPIADLLLPGQLELQPYTGEVSDLYEICITGPALSSGYLNEQTSSSANFTEKSDGTRMLCTGDLAYKRGELLYFYGRKDSQIKLNGYRIELSEIDAQIARFSAVKDCACVGLKRQQKVIRILAYVTWVAGTTDSAAAVTELRNFLQQRIPAHMIPAEFITVDNIPLNSNGKVDRQKLTATYLSNSIVNGNQN